MSTKQLFIACSTLIAAIAIFVGVNYFKTSQNIKLQQLEIEREKMVKDAEIKKAQIQAEVIKKETELNTQARETEAQEKSERAWMHRLPGLRKKDGDE